MLRWILRSLALASLLFAVVMVISPSWYHAGRSWIEPAWAEEIWIVEPGTTYSVRPEDLPPPGATASASNPPRRVQRPEQAWPQVPPGFKVTLFAEGLGRARWLEVAPNGDVFLTQPRDGQITLLRDSKGDGKADIVQPFLKGLSNPHGMAFQPGAFYFADVRGVWRVPYEAGDQQASATPRLVTRPGALGGRSGHSTRILAFDPTGERFYVAVGSAGNIAVEKTPRATVQVFDADGKNQADFATGLRNPVGLTFHPETGKLYTVVNERDGMGDELVPDYLTEVREGAFYGWPYAYIGPNPQPGFAERAPDLVAETVVPDLLFRSHSAPLGLVFYEGASFPADYQGDAFVALHGSWNAAKPRGYMVARVPFENGQPQGGYEAFMTGFWQGGSAPAQVWGRPAGLAVWQDGSLLIADDTAGVIWRVSYEG